MTISSGSLVEITANMLISNQQMLNVWHYQILDLIGPVGAVQLTEAWWNDVKANYRALFAGGGLVSFKTIRLRELNNPTGDYCEFDVPLGEQAGTRTVTGEAMPPFTSVGVRLTVATRATRPGQKRFSCLWEQDQNAGVIASGVQTAVNTFMLQMVNILTLDAPALLSTLQPIVVRKDSAGNVVANQVVTGHLINVNVTSQNTRKLGRGA